MPFFAHAAPLLFADADVFRRRHFRLFSMLLRPFLLFRLPRGSACYARYMLNVTIVGFAEETAVCYVLLPCLYFCATPRYAAPYLYAELFLRFFCRC